MGNNENLFYEDKKKNIIGLQLSIICFVFGICFLVSYVIKKDSTEVSDIVHFFGLSIVSFLGYLYMRSKYILVTKKELETVLFFKKRVYKLEVLKSYECKKVGISKYYYFTMYFAEKVCVVSVLDREKFATLLNAVIEKNNANSNTNGGAL